MKSISVILNEHSKYTIDLKDEYKLDEFINFFETEMQIVKGYTLDSSVANPLPKRGHPEVTGANVGELTEDDC